jgi:hypothetical protein
MTKAPFISPTQHLAESHDSDYSPSMFKLWGKSMPTLSQNLPIDTISTTFARARSES